MTFDDLPLEIVETYREQYRNATAIEKERVESCLRALTCVADEVDKIKSRQPLCQDIEKLCITSNTFFSDNNSDSPLEDSLDKTSSDRLAITYFSGENWSPSQRRDLLECKIETLLCQLTENNNDSLDRFIYEQDAFYIDIRSGATDYEDYYTSKEYDDKFSIENSKRRCVSGK